MHYGSGSGMNVGSSSVGTGINIGAVSVNMAAAGVSGAGVVPPPPNAQI